MNVLPRRGCIQTVHHGKRTKEAGEQCVKTIKQNSDGEAPLFLSDGWPSYPEIFANTSSHEEAVPYSGRGRPRKPIRIIDEHLKYAHIVHHKEGGHLIEREREASDTGNRRRDMRDHPTRGKRPDDSYELCGEPQWQLP